MKGVLFSEVDKIQSPDIKEFTIQALGLAPDYFWVIPASSSGKYHPMDSLGKGGLVRHTKKVIYFAGELCRAYEMDDQRQVDSIASACILHDTLKNGFPNSGHTIDEHPLLPRKHYQGIAHLTESFDQIMDCMEPHMGQWGLKGGARKPESQAEWVVHLADYIASRKEVSLDQGDGAQPNVEKKGTIKGDGADKVQNYLRLKEEERGIKEELAAMRESFVQELDKAGGDSLITPTGVVKRAIYTKVVFDAEKVKEILDPRGLLEEVETITIDEDKVNELIERGDVSKEDLSESYSERQIVSIRVTKR